MYVVDAGPKQDWKCLDLVQCRMHLRDLRNSENVLDIAPFIKVSKCHNCSILLMISQLSLLSIVLYIISCSYEVILWKFHANSIFPCITNCRLLWKWVLLMELLVSQLFKHSTTFFSILEGIGHYVSHAKSSEIQSSLFLLKISRIISIWPCMIYPPLNT